MISHDVTPITFLPSSFRSPPVGPQVYIHVYNIHEKYIDEGKRQTKLSEDVGRLGSVFLPFSATLQLPWTFF